MAREEQRLAVGGDIELTDFINFEEKWRQGHAKNNNTTKNQGSLVRNEELFE